MVEEVAATAVPHLEIGDTIVVPTDGRPARALVGSSTGEGLRIVVIDLARDWTTASRVAAAVAREAPDSGLPPEPLQDLADCLATASIAVTPVRDTPGLILMRIMAQLASVAADAATIGVATPADIDLAMRAGTNYPEGPLEWVDRVGSGTIVSVLDHMRDHYGEDRYRVAATLRDRAYLETDSRERSDG
jgi:3-hydroxybutyryl-CoA dehydrogenase